MRIVLLAPVVLAACADSQSSNPPPATIAGVSRVVHWDEAGNSTAVAEPARDRYITAELASGDVVPAAIADDGSFTIAAAPAAPYWLRLVDTIARADTYVFSDAAMIDLGRDVVGGHDGVAASPATLVLVDAPGLAPWQDGDDGDFVIPDLGYQSSIATFYAANLPVAGDTGLHDAYAWQAQPIAARADAAVFVQLRPAHDDALALDYVAPVSTFRSTPFAITEAATTQVGGTFTAPTPLDVPVRWTRSAFIAEAAAMQPAACAHDLDIETYWVHALPAHGAHGELARTFDDGSNVPENGPRVVEPVFVDGTSDLDGSLHVGNPYPRDWLYAKYELAFVIQCPLPDGRSPGNAEAAIGVVTDDLDTAAVPLVGPVGAPQIAGRDLMSLQLGVGHAPEIRWTAPAIGTATSFELHLSEVVLAGPFGGGASLHEDAVLLVPGDVTTITLPRDVLADGTLYTLRIRAITRAGQAVATAPFAAGLPLGYADLYTGYFQP
jgi:hypothetical protein